MVVLWWYQGISTFLISLFLFLSFFRSLSLAFLFLICPQADATQQRVVKREDGERLAKVSVTLKKLINTEEDAD